MDGLNKHDVCDQDISDMLELLDRMKKKYGERYKDMIAFLYDLTELEAK